MRRLKNVRTSVEQLVITHTPPPFFCNRIRQATVGSIRLPTATLCHFLSTYTIRYLPSHASEGSHFLYGAEADADFFPRRAS